MSEPRKKPDKPDQQGNQDNQGKQDTEGNQGDRPRDPRSLIYHEERSQNPDRLTTKDIRPGQRMIETKDQ